MPKRHQQRPSREQQGRNNPRKSTINATGSYKKPETYEQQARAHENPVKRAQAAKVHPRWVMNPDVTTTKADSRIMMERGERRSGSYSDAHKHRKGARLHEKAERQPEAKPVGTDDFEEDLRPDNLAGVNYGPVTEPRGTGLRAIDVKDLYGKLADLTKDELRSIVIVPVGERLEQGAKYIDLQHLERGEFVATAEIISEEGHYYVPKKQTDYVLWNRLNQVSNPARLDETDRT